MPLVLLAAMYGIQKVPWDGGVRQEIGTQFPGVTSVEISDTRGDVAVREGFGGVVNVRFREDNLAAGDTLALSPALQSGNELKVGDPCSGQSAACRITTIVEVPMNVPVTVQRDGAFRINGMSGRVTSTGSSEVDVMDFTGQLDVTSDGPITVTNSTVDFLTVKGNWQNVSVDLLNTPQTAQIETVSGDVELKLASEPPSLTFETNRGERSTCGRDAVPTPGGTGTGQVTVKTTSGDLDVCTPAGNAPG